MGEGSSEKVVSGTGTGKNKKRRGIYAHVPFCEKKCSYCSFVSFSGLGRDKEREYISALLREIRWRATVAAEAEEGDGASVETDSVFIGGGTPSFIATELVLRMLEEIKTRINLAQDSEISIEANPSSISKEKLREWKAAGVNRLSIGVQSTLDETLGTLGRVHDRRDVFACFDMAREAGFTNINVDLIFAVPGQTEAQWEACLAEVIGLKPEHISFYSLELEENTPIYERCAKGELTPVDEAVDRNMYRSALKLLRDHGYQQYEISNAALPGFQCRHNLKYWSMDEYMGFGLAAHSFLDGRRSSNITELDRYIAAEARGFEEETHKNTRRELISESMFLGLRKREGVCASEFRDYFGEGLFELFEKEIRRAVKEGLLEIRPSRREGRREFVGTVVGHKRANEGRERDFFLSLTEKGIDFSNRVFLEFMLPPG